MTDFVTAVKALELFSPLRAIEVRLGDGPRLDRARRLVGTDRRKEKCQCVTSLRR